MLWRFDFSQPFWLGRDRSSQGRPVIGHGERPSPELATLGGLESCLLCPVRTPAEAMSSALMTPGRGTFSSRITPPACICSNHQVVADCSPFFPEKIPDLGFPRALSLTRDQGPRFPTWPCVHAAPPVSRACGYDTLSLWEPPLHLLSRLHQTDYPKEQRGTVTKLSLGRCIMGKSPFACQRGHFFSPYLFTSPRPIFSLISSGIRPPSLLHSRTHSRLE